MRGNRQELGPAKRGAIAVTGQCPVTAIAASALTNRVRTINAYDKSRCRASFRPLSNCRCAPLTRPLGTDRGRHVTVAVLQMMGTHYRQLAKLFSTAGLHLQLPYFDDRVIEAMLAVPA